MRVTFPAGLAFALVLTFTAAAQAMESARVSMFEPDWDAAAAAVPDRPDGPVQDIFARLNAAAAQRFPGIAVSPVPVLLPFDIAAALKAKAAGKDADKTDGVVAAGFRPSKFFLPGPAGYDATFFIKSSEVSGLGIKYPKPVEVEIAGAVFAYDLDDPNIVESTHTPRALTDEFPGIRRILREAHARYSFTRFGVPYVVSIECFNGRVTAKRLSCKDADLVAVRFLNALQVAGGTPTRQISPPRVDLTRPTVKSMSFSYHSAGSLIPNSGYKTFGGRADNHVYARIRFPISGTPAFAVSQSFMHWGDCYMKGKIGRTNRKGAPYRCKLNDKQLVFDESAPENFSYPWRDNFCETRDTQVGQCPGGTGHQGQDIRPASCVLNNEGADRCEPYQHDVVAVRDGMIWRNTADYVVYESVYVVVNTANERVRFRYMHMDPKRMDTDGIASGRRVRQGEVIGQVGNYNKKENGTSYHLHFDTQVWTQDGWVWVNPYMTLVSAYERLIGARGAEIKDGEARPVAVPGIPPQIKVATPVAEQNAAPAPKKQHRQGRRKFRKSNDDDAG